MSHGDNNYDWMQSFFPGWREEDQPQGNRSSGGPDQAHHQNPHPAFADAAQMAQAARAAHVQFQQSRSSQARAAQMNQQGQNSSPYSQGMDQTLFRSQLHHHSQYEQPQQHTQQPQAQQQHQQQVRQQALHLPQPQPYRQAQAQLLVQQQAREQAEREQAEQQAREQAQRDAQQQAEVQAQTQANPRPQQDRPQPPLQQYQYREAPQQQQYVRPSDIKPPGPYYQSNTINRPYTPLAPMQSPVLTQRPASGSTLAQPSPTTSQSPVEAHSCVSTGEPPHKSYTAPSSHSAGQRSSSSLAASPTEPPLPDPSSQRNSTTHTTQQIVPDTRPQTPPRARRQSQASSNQPEASRRGSFLEDVALFSTKSPQKDPYTSSSRSTFRPRANSSNVAASTATPSAPTKPPVVSHSHPSPNARPASVSVPPSSSASASGPVTVPAQPRTSGSPPVTNSTAAAAASNQPSIGSSATSASIKSPAMPPVSYAVPQALRTYATPQMLNSYAATQAQKAPASSQPSAQTVRSTSAPSVYSVTSKPTVPAEAPQMPKATVPPQTSAQAARSMPAASASPVSPTWAAPTVPQTHKATIHPQTTAPIARGISAPAPLDNFTPFRPASNPRTTPGASVPGSPKPLAAPSTSTSGRNSPLSSQVRSVAGPRRKKGRPPIYPDAVGPNNQSAGPQTDGYRWKVSSQTNPPPNGIPSQYQPLLSGLPVFRDLAPASTFAPARAPAPPLSWQSRQNYAYPASGPTPPLVNRSEPASSRFSPGAARAIPRTLPPGRAYQPQSARVYTTGPVKSRRASTQPPAAKIRKLDDRSRQPLTPSPATLDLGQYVRQSPSRKHITYRSDVVEQMKSSDVLIQLEYDPATIARDILIAADKHPTEKSLNHHLHSLRQNFQAVDYSSDLASFRWDLVDPWVNYPPSVEQAASRVNQMPANSITRLETISRPPNLPPNLPPSFPGPTSAGQSMPHVSARDVPTAPLARPVESRPAYNTNADITTTTTTTSPGTANLSLSGPNKNSGFTGPGTISSGSFNSGQTGANVTSTGVRRNIPGLSNPLGSYAFASTIASTSSFTTSPPHKSTPKPAPTPPSAVNLNAFGALPFKPPSYYSPLRPTAQPLPHSLPSFFTPSSSPPRVNPSLSSTSSESHTSVSAPVSVAAAAPAPQSSPRKSAKSTPVPSSSSTPIASSPPSNTPRAPSQSPRGKAPRQSPLPKGLPEPQVVIPTSPHGMVPPKKKPGRPPQQDMLVEVAIDNRPATQYQVFKCKWTGCKAELHNLDAIHTHILAIHIPHHIVCGWDDCTDKNHRAAADMWEHVRKKHMIPLAWQLGDGPSASVTAADGYEEPELSGQGRQDTMTLPADRASVKIFSRIHGTQTSQQMAQLMKESGRQWKEDAGPDMDTSDRPLSTPPRLMASSHTESAYTMSKAVLSMERNGVAGKDPANSLHGSALAKRAKVSLRYLLSWQNQA